MVGAYLAVLSQAVLLGHSNSLPGERYHLPLLVGAGEELLEQPFEGGLGPEGGAAGMSVAPSLLRDDKCLDGRILRWGW